MLNIGIIGYGGRMHDVMKCILKYPEVRLTAITDMRNDELRVEMEENGLKNIHYYTDAEEMLKNETLDGVCIGTRCSSHTHYALLVAKYNIPMFLEKPVCTTEEDLERLKGILHINDKVVVSFPLRLTRLLQNVKEIVDSGKLGSIEHVQAYNNVPYGRGYYHKWYRDEKETGGLFLQKATHDLDYINYLLGDNKPVRICAMKSKQIFKGDEPEGLLCSECPKAPSCPESPQNVEKNGDGYVIGPYCCFAKDTGNEDSGSIIIEYESGMHVVYSQNFVVRNGAGKRGARLIGYKGTLEFDWNKSLITVYKHLENVTETYEIKANKKGHGGGDAFLAENFVNVMKGTDVSRATLEEGILSAQMCLLAKKSSEEHKFLDM